MESWVKLFRKFREWEWYGDSNVSRIFIELLLTVNIKDKNWRGISIKRGQILTGIEELGKRIGINRQQTRSAIDKLISTKEITKSSTATYTIITVNNYEKYQTVTKLVTNEQPSSNQVITTTKEYKKEKNIKKIISVREKSPYSDINSLKDLELEEIANKYQVPVSFVRSKHDDMINWHEKNPTKNYYKNYLSALRDWVKRDALKIKLDYGKQNSEVSI